LGENYQANCKKIIMFEGIFHLYSPGTDRVTSPDIFREFFLRTLDNISLFISKLNRHISHVIV
jgi:hypothetical protein